MEAPRALKPVAPPWRSKMARRKSDSGQTLVFVALTLPVLLGFLGLAIDMGYLRYVKRQVQMAADAAALAGALELGHADVANAAQTSVSGDNLFPNVTQSTGCTATPATGATVVLVNNPPACLSTDPHNGNNNYVEVYVFRNVPTLFSKILGFSSATVGARGEAGYSPNCVFALAPSGSDTLLASGDATLTASCGVVVDSNDSKALENLGGGCIRASSIQIVGGYTPGKADCPSPTPRTGIKPVSNPLAYLTPPGYGGCDYTNLNVTGVMTLNPGTYCGGITIQSSGNVRFNSGTYVLLGGGLAISGGGTTSGTGVTFFDTGNATYTFRPITISGSASVSFSAPTGGSYAGILFYQDPNAPGAGSNQKNQISGGTTSAFTGGFYFPTTSLYYAGSGTSSSVQYTILVAYTINLSGSFVVNSDYSSLPGGSPIKSGSVVLGE